MLKSLIIDTVNDVVEYVPNRLAHVCKDMNFVAEHGEALKRFLPFYISNSLEASLSPYN
jgi:hypothetical protein